MNKNKIILLSFIVINFSFFIFIFYLIKKSDYPISIGPVKEESDIFPISLDDKSVQSLTFSYTLRGKIREVKKVSDNYIIKLEDNVSEIPISNQTNILKDNSLGSIEKTSIKDISVNNTVTIGTFYNPIQKTWTTSTVIVKINTESISPTPNQLKNSQNNKNNVVDLSNLFK
ncbi:MAG: hypothetical protein EXS44_03090 [Candidatus Levybacteria bacterium]|nr:hypothetical protein [Candidatus Levybacteria bacterium]